jgi:hypothetical protein
MCPDSGCLWAFPVSGRGPHCTLFLIHHQFQARFARSNVDERNRRKFGLPFKNNFRTVGRSTGLKPGRTNFTGFRVNQYRIAASLGLPFFLRHFPSIVHIPTHLGQTNAGRRITTFFQDPDDRSFYLRHVLCFYVGNRKPVRVREVVLPEHHQITTGKVRQFLLS